MVFWQLFLEHPIFTFLSSASSNPSINLPIYLNWKSGRQAFSPRPKKPLKNYKNKFITLQKKSAVKIKVYCTIKRIRRLLNIYDAKNENCR
jgi:hypothetical protein